jgi:signal transduction histidine kinase
MVVVSLPAIASLLAGMGCVYLGWLTWQRRDRPAAWAWLGVVATFSLWALAYGVGLLVHDLALRRAFEYPLWLAKPFAAFFLFTFGLEYSGRGHLVRSPWTLLHAGVWGVGTLLYWTNPLHHLMWEGYRIVPTLGAATVTYARQPLLLAFHGLAYLVITAMVFMLVDAVVSYGSVYRRRTALLVVGVGLPTVASPVHMLNLGPYPRLNFTPIAFFAFAVCGMYALFQRDMFEVTPAARRAGERAVIDDLGTPVVVVDERERVVTLDDAAAATFDVDPSAAQAEPLAAVVDADVGVDGGERTVPVEVESRRRQFAVTTSTVEGPGGRDVGQTVVFQDVTEERRRKQRLEVQNRVLRHNLRNDSNVIKLNAEALRERVDDEATDVVATIERKAGDLQGLGGKASALAEAFGTDEEPDLHRIDLHRVVAGICEDLASRYPDREVRVDVPADVALRSNEQLVQLAVSNLVENALEHGGEDSHVEVTLAGVDDGGVAELVVRDDGPGIPDHEVDVIERGEETALEHGSGLGLWLVAWSVPTLGGTVSSEAGDAGTTVTLRLPGADGGAGVAVADG